MLTSMESLGEGGKIRKNGIITKVPHVYKTKNIDFGNGVKMMVTIPWGDVATSGYTTGIPNISVYIPMQEKQMKQLKIINFIPWFVKMKFIQNYLKQNIIKNFKGTSDEERKDSKSFIWGEISKNGKLIEGRLETKNGYDVTADGSIEVIKYIEKNEINGGYYTPSQLCGSDLIERLPGSSKINIKEK